MDTDTDSRDNPIREILFNLIHPIQGMIQICNEINAMIPNPPREFVPRNTTMLQSQSQSQIGTGQVPTSGQVATGGPPAEEWQTKRLLGSAWGSSKNAMYKLGEGIGSTLMVPAKIAGATLTGTGDILGGIASAPAAVAKQTAKIKMPFRGRGGAKTQRGYKKFNNNTKKKKEQK